MNSSILETVISLPEPEREIARISFEEMVKKFKWRGSLYGVVPDYTDNSQFKQVILKIWEMGNIRLVKDAYGLYQWEIKDAENREWLLLPTFGG